MTMTAAALATSGGLFLEESRCCALNEKRTLISSYGRLAGPVKKLKVISSITCGYG
jgi:hypothetical protein